MSESVAEQQERSVRMRSLLKKSAEKLPGSVRYRLLNACDGVERAEKLLDLDKEIASFRAINAQEEAACAVFNSLKIKKYPRAEELNLYSHPHKAAFWFIVDALHHSLGQGMKDLNFNYAVDATKPEVEISIPAKQFGVELSGAPNLAIQLVDPFHFLQSRGGLPDAFEAEINELLTARGARKVDRYVKALANDRNKILYATDQALPVSRATLASIRSRRDRIYLAVVLCIGILQTDTIQHFIDQGLQALLKAVGKAADGQEKRAHGDVPPDGNRLGTGG